MFDNKSQYLDESSTHPQRSAQLNGIKATLVSMAGDEKNAYFVIDFENTNGRESLKQYSLWTVSNKNK